MLIPIPPKKRRNTDWRSFLKPPSTNPPVLIGVDYIAEGFVTLRFDRDVNLSAIVPNQFTVDDGATEGFTFQGTAASLVTSSSVRITLVPTVEYLGSGVTLTVSRLNGIKSSADGALWGGCSGVVIPFG